ncbi:LacI family transcriptional regulator [Sphingopyxis lindanitolerans]|uniref:LacI family transcriptional regulator n=1 Tax=Sphingopyxis lindanitolerans TaxID=2054227 RepID=A0A2S8B2H2_9SPHN|nr:LacI family DNA-binding transcriptional regulator [Sphingopyxis lindanitolerans]PQM26508.1 LacI family transcriptional regulator [Sphingopyxis lindanitolerans]
MARKRVTLKDVAKAAGVSLASTSYAVNKTGSLGDDTRAHILKVAGELGYRQNLSARATRTGRTGALGLVVPDMTNPFFPSLAQSIVQRARQNGYSVFVTDTEGDQAQEEEVVRQLIDRGVDGIVWFPVKDENSIEKIAADLPIVVIDRTVPGFECIQADYGEGGRLAADHLLSLGHQRIGVVAGPMDVRSMRDRCGAAQEAIARAGALAFSVENAFSTELSGAVAQAIESREASAVFCGSDLIAIGVLKLARKLGIETPEQLAIVGFDDIPWAEYCTPALTTIEMPVDEMAAEAVDALLRKIDGDNESNRRVIFGVTLVERESTAPAR